MTGRNAPCPCGSGKKYKKCCLVLNTKPSGNQHAALSGRKPEPLDPTPLFQQQLHTQSSNSAPRDNAFTQPADEPMSTQNHEQAPPPGKENTISRLLDKSSALELIGKLSIEDLQFLNRHIANRLKQLYQAKQTSALMEFYPGQRVGFMTKYGDYKTGTIIRVNKKTVSVDVDDYLDGYWKVSPTLLKKLD